MECRGTDLGRRRPKLKKCRVPDTQIGFQLTTFEALRAKKVKKLRAAKQRVPVVKLHLNNVFNRLRTAVK
jgi:hypothetical protein